MSYSTGGLPLKIGNTYNVRIWEYSPTFNVSSVVYSKVYIGDKTEFVSCIEGQSGALASILGVSNPFAGVGNSLKTTFPLLSLFDGSDLSKEWPNLYAFFSLIIKIIGGLLMIPALVFYGIFLLLTDGLGFLYGLAFEDTRELAIVNGLSFLFNVLTGIGAVFLPIFIIWELFIFWKVFSLEGDLYNTLTSFASENSKMLMYAFNFFTVVFTVFSRLTTIVYNLIKTLIPM